MGLPLGLVLADAGMNVCLLDVNGRMLDEVRHGRMPFEDRGAQEVLDRVLAAGRLSFSTETSAIAGVPIVIVTIATPVDEYQNPDFKVFTAWADAAAPHLSPDQLIVLRSTIYPGTTEWVDKHFREAGRPVQVAYCPERIVQGFAVEELHTLPQIVSGTSEVARRRAAELFERIGTTVVPLAPMEAEFAKLFANAYRYILFAIANQFYMVADSAGVDYNRVLTGLKTDYPRAKGVPGAGFTAGPCLYKDTMQLAAFSQNHFPLGHAAVVINEGLILYLVERIKQQYDMEKTTIGLLGMAFKSDCDDIRSSLSYKLKKLLKLSAKRVIAADPHVVVDPELLPVDEVIEQSDLLILCTPHAEFKNLDLRGKPLLDVWGIYPQSV